MNETKTLNVLYHGRTVGRLAEMAGEWIIKFPTSTDPANSGKCEYDYSVCARDCGIPMTATGLVPSAVCDGYFKTERFDRKDGKKSLGSLLPEYWRLTSGHRPATTKHTLS